MRKTIFTAALLAAAAVVAVPADAAVFFSFGPGLSVADLSGATLVNAFEVDAGIVGSGYKIKSSPSDSEGAVIPTSVPTGTNYLSVLGGGVATIALPGGTSAFGFDWGSLDTYNTLTISYNGGSTAVAIPGTTIVNTDADGNQFQPGTNGLFYVYGTAGETFDSITLTSGSNSFEIDNLVSFGAVPEPATWALMIGGFVLIGASARRRKTSASIQFA